MIDTIMAYKIAYPLTMILFCAAMLYGDNSLAIIFLGFGILFKICIRELE